MFISARLKLALVSIIYLCFFNSCGCFLEFSRLGQSCTVSDFLVSYRMPREYNEDEDPAARRRKKKRWNKSEGVLGFKTDSVRGRE